ncbi:MAG TPA: hypothetical protein VN376_09990 [Longilinea sp.]|nr:hypothetical protein [Longilinea sp.]
MENGRIFWDSWVHNLQRWGLSQPAAILLDALGPLTSILAQVVYAGGPLLSNQKEKWEAMAAILEDKEQTNAFTALLRREELG